MVEMDFYAVKVMITINETELAKVDVSKGEVIEQIEKQMVFIKS